MLVPHLRSSRLSLPCRTIEWNTVENTVEMFSVGPSLDLSCSICSNTLLVETRVSGSLAFFESFVSEPQD